MSAIRIEEAELRSEAIMRTPRRLDVDFDR
jgi:hypothetical protein